MVNKNPRSRLRGIPSAALIDFAASSGESDPKRLKLTYLLPNTVYTSISIPDFQTFYPKKFSRIKLVCGNRAVSKI